MRMIADWVDWFQSLEPLKQFNVFMLFVIAFTVMIKSMWKILLS